MVAGWSDQTATLLDAVPTVFNKFGEHRRRRQALAVVSFQRAKAVAVDVEAGHIRYRERAEERQPVAERRADDGVHILRRGNSLLDEIEGFLQKDVLQPVEYEAGLVIDSRCEFAGTRNQGLNCLDDRPPRFPRE